MPSPIKLLFIVTALLIAIPASADSTFYCGRKLVEVGDPIYRVDQRCPSPFYTEQWSSIQPGRGTVGFDAYPVDSFEAWYLNFGSRKLMRRLVFRNGYLYRVDELGHGVRFEPGSRKCRPADLENSGSSIGEVFANCGEPDFVLDYPVILRRPYGRPNAPLEAIYRTRWVYDFGSRRLTRALVFEDGRLINIEVEND